MTSIRMFCIHTVDSKLLRSFFSGQGLELDEQDLPAEAEAKELAALVKTKLSAATMSTRQGVMDAIDRIDKLASECGEVALYDTTISDGLAELPSRHARALHVFVHDEAGFRRAEGIFFNDTRRGSIRQWTAFPAEVGLQVARDDTALEKLKEAMRSHFNTNRVYLEIFDRTRIGFLEDGENGEEAGKSDLVQITVYREDRPNTVLAFVGDTIGTEIRRSVLEASITYEPRTGMIECVAPHRDDRADIARLLAVNVLGCSPDFEPVPARAYDLSVLKQRVAFDSEPIDRIEKVSVSMMKLVPTETNAELITVETKRTSERDIWAVIDDRLGADALTSDYTIQQALIVIRYKSSDSNRTRSLPVMITHPNRSNLKEQTEIERAVWNKYLPRWGLVAA
jgi:hypothetical protein